MPRSPEVALPRARQHSRIEMQEQHSFAPALRPFKHRINPMGGVDSICLRCNALVASSKDEWSLLQSEAVHLCKTGMAIQSQSEVPQ